MSVFTLRGKSEFSLLETGYNLDFTLNANALYNDGVRIQMNICFFLYCKTYTFFFL